MSQLLEPSEMVIQRLARFVAEADLSLDETTMSVARDALIDTLGCILAGARQPVAKRTRTTLAAWGTGLAPVLGTELCLPAPWAAMANAVAGHALDFDDWEVPGNTHPSGVLFPALLAVAAGQPISGQKIVEAYVAGFEVIARIGEAVNYEHYAKGWHATATLGAIGAAAAVARLKGLTAQQTAHALSISVSQAIGLTCQFGSDTKSLQAGFAAKTGVLAASLAENGLTGQPHVLEAAKGFSRLMADGDASRFAPALQQLGNPLALAQYALVIKPYPSCGYTHRVTDCAIAMREQITLDFSQIERITASLPDFHAAVLPFYQPTVRTEALFSLPFNVSLALLRGNVTLTDMENEAWTEPAIMELIAKVTLNVRTPKNPTLNYDHDDPDWLEIEMKDGTRHRTEVAFPLGTPENRMSGQQIMQKFLSNTGFTEEEMAQKEDVIRVLTEWDSAVDINQVVYQFGSVY